MQEARSRGETPCVLPLIRGSLLAYTRAPREVTRPAQLSGCQLVLSFPFDPRSMLRAARRDFGHRWELQPGRR